MAYQYDVFISYNRQFPNADWVNDNFLPLFRAYLGDSLNRAPVIFQDTHEIRTGNDWQHRIRNGVIHSRVMVSILAPLYFSSEWCMREFTTMNHRQLQLGYLTDENPGSLILPIKLFDGKHYPEFATRMQLFDCKAYNLVGGGFKNSAAYLELQNRLQDFADEVAVAIHAAPPFDLAWRDKSWVEEPYELTPLAITPTHLAPPSL